MDVIDNLLALSVEVDHPNFERAAISHVVVSPAEPFPSPLPLLLENTEIVWPWLSQFHRGPNLPPPMPICCYLIRDLVMVGHDVLLLNGRLAVGPEAIPAYRSRQIQGDHHHVMQARFALPTKTIEEPCFPLASDGNVYGHFLIEAMARLYTVQHLLQGDLPAFKVLIVKTLPGWLRTILREVFGVRTENLIEYDPETERVWLKHAIWPGLSMVGDHMHSFTNRAVEDLLSRFAQSGGLVVEKIFLTRSFFRNPVMQDLGFENEHQVAELAAREFGFCPMAPETLPWTEQIKLFAGARVIAGRFGSGLHNALFCRPGARVGVIRFGNLVQSSISALRAQRLAYSVDGTEKLPFTANMEHVRRVFDALVTPPPPTFVTIAEEACRD
jgi:hypothetical protein